MFSLTYIAGEMKVKENFISSSYFDIMRKDIDQQYRRIGHALDNYGMNMTKELKEALEELYKVTRKVQCEMSAEYAESNRINK